MRARMGGVAVAGALALTAGSADAAFDVNIATVTGEWTSATLEGGGSATGVNSNTISWGTSTGQGQSSYVFNGNAPSGPFALGDTFTLGEFTHNNNPVLGNDLVTATLEVNVTGTVVNGSSGSFDVTSVFDFAHDETSNIGPGNCCDDIVTATTNVGGTETFPVGDNDFAFIYSGFLVGGAEFDQFFTEEGESNTASLQAQVVPLPAALPLMLGGLGAVYGVARRRRAAATA